MPKAVKVGKGTLLSVEKICDKPEYEYDWRYNYIGATGILTIYMSLEKHQGELFCYLLTSDGRYIRTGCGQVETIPDQSDEQYSETVRITTKNSVYTFQHWPTLHETYIAREVPFALSEPIRNCLNQVVKAYMDRKLGLSNADTANITVYIEKLQQVIQEDPDILPIKGAWLLEPFLNDLEKYQPSERTIRRFVH